MPLSGGIIIVALTATIFFSTASTAKEFIVGDDKGWTVGFDYQAWAGNKVFHVGDKLIFKYLTGQHNVFRVNGAEFKNCTVPAGTEGLSTGEDGVVLESPGRRWYLCGVGNHCQNGQKIFINVLPQTQTQAPSPAPSPSVLAVTLPPTPAAPWASSSSPSPSPSPSHLPARHNIGMSRFNRWVPRKLTTFQQ